MADEFEPTAGSEAPEVERHCPVCGRGDVRLLSEGNQLPVAVREGPVTWPTIRADVFICGACGFLMLHAEDPRKAPTQF